VDSKFITAFILPDRWDIVGYKLRPYSPRIMINLSAVDSPYMSGQVPTAEDTVKFLKFCSSDCESIVDIPDANIFDSFVFLKAKYQPSFHIFLIKAISNYIKEYSSGPNYRVVSTGSSKSQTLIDSSTLPELLSLIAICMSKLNITEKDAMNMPIAKLTWYGAAVAMMAGADIRIGPDESQSEKDAEVLRDWEKAQAEKLRLAMVNGKIPKRKIVTPNLNG
jgi:hypothetical protein